MRPKTPIRRLPIPGIGYNLLRAGIAVGATGEGAGLADG